MTTEAYAGEQIKIYTHTLKSAKKMVKGLKANGEKAFFPK